MTLTAHIHDTTAAGRLYEAAHREGATMVTVSAEDLRQLLSTPSQTNCGNTQPLTAHIGISESESASDLLHQHNLLGQALGECIAAAGIIREGVGLTGPELLMFADDLKSHLAGAVQSQAAYNAVITYILANPNESPIEFLHCWNEGNFDSLRAEWPDAPEEIYLADSQHPDFKS